MRFSLQQAMLLLLSPVVIWLGEGEALLELKNSIVSANKGLAKWVATDPFPRNRTGVTCTGDSITAINLLVSVPQAKFQKVC